MITGALKSKIDSIWDTMWSGGISNPLSVIEQLTYLLFMKRLDELRTLKERKAARTGTPIQDPVFTAKQDKLRWSRFKDAAPEQLFETVRDGSPLSSRSGRRAGPTAAKGVAHKALTGSDQALAPPMQPGPGALAAAPLKADLEWEWRGSMPIRARTSNNGVHVHGNPDSPCATALPYVAGRLAVARRPPERRCRSGACGCGWERSPASACLDRHRGGRTCVRTCHPSRRGRS